MARARVGDPSRPGARPWQVRDERHGVGGLLDRLVNLAGELVLARNQILQYTATQEDTGFVATTQRLNLITTELQEGVMKTRMQPIGNVLGKFPRVVRDLALAIRERGQTDAFGANTRVERNDTHVNMSGLALLAIYNNLATIE